MSDFSKQLGQMTKAGGWWDTIDTGLNIAGMVPGVGFLANGASALGNLAQGNWGQAGLSALGMIPGVGALTGAAKGVGMASRVARGAQWAGKAMNKAPMLSRATTMATPGLRALQPYANMGNTARMTIEGGQMAGGLYDMAHGAFNRVPRPQPQYQSQVQQQPQQPQYQPPQPQQVAQAPQQPSYKQHSIYGNV